MASEDTVYPQFVMHLDKEAYKPGDTVHVTLVLNDTKYSPSDFNVEFQVLPEGSEVGRYVQDAQFQGKTLNFSYTLLPDKTTWYQVIAFLSKSGQGTVDSRTDFIYTSDMPDGMAITNFRMNNVAFQPSDSMYDNFTVIDKNGTVLIPQYAYSMFCFDTAGTNCTSKWSDNPNGNGTMQGGWQADIPTEYSGSYKLKTVVIGPKGTEYRPATYITDFSVQGSVIPHWQCASDSSDSLCFDMDVMGPIPQQQEAGGTYHILAKVQPNVPLNVKVYDPTIELIYNNTFQTNQTGIVSADYKIPENASDGFYNVQLLDKNPKGKSYYRFVFHLGGSGPGGAPSSSGETLFQLNSITQEGEVSDSYGYRFVLDRPITLALTTVTPIPHVPIPNQEVNVKLTDPDGNITKSQTNSDSSGNLVFTFTPIKSGHYGLVMSTAYQGTKDNFLFSYPVGLYNNFTISAGGKVFPIKFDFDWYSGVEIRNVTFNQQEKRLTIDLGKTDIDQILQPEIPYELLDGGLTAFTNGEPVLIGEQKGYTTDHVGIPVDDSVRKVDVVGTTAIPEFPFAVPILLISIVSVIAFYRVKIRK